MTEVVAGLLAVVAAEVSGCGCGAHLLLEEIAEVVVGSSELVAVWMVWCQDQCVQRDLMGR